MLTRFVPLPFVATVALLGATLIVTDLSARRIPDTLSVPLDHIDREIAGWTAVPSDNVLSPRVVEVLDPTSYLSRTYRRGATSLDLFIAYYAQQRAGESMHSPKHCLPGGGWEIWKHDSMLVPVNQGRVRINKYSIQNNGQRMLMCYWYQSRDRIVASEYEGKLLLARDTLLTGHTAGSIVRIVLPDTPGAEQDAAAFATQIIPQMQRSFGSTVPLQSE